MKNFPYQLQALIVAALVLLPLFASGYVMTFDMAWGDHLVSQTMTDNSWILYSIINFLSSFIYGDLIQKIILFLILFLAYCGSYKLLTSFIQNGASFTYTFGALVYIFNPFFYTRLIAGQWLVLIGYALLPWAIRSFYGFVKTPTLKTAWPVAAWTGIIGLTSLHTIGIVFVAFIAIALYSGRDRWKDKVKWLAAIAVTWCLINITWLAPFTLGQSSVADDINGISRSEMVAFATKGTILDSPPVSATLLTGFWADDTNRYILPSQLPVWWIGVLVIMTLVIIGIIQIIRRRDKLGYTVICVGVVAWLLGIGIAWIVSAPLTDLLIHIFPYYSGYREPQKWLMLLALTYAYLVTYGAQWIYARTTEHRSVWFNYSFVTILLVSPFLFASPLLWGAAGQLKPVNYPDQWQDAKTYLNNNTTNDTRVLVLPWHMYLPVSFVGRVVGNPAGYYFDQKMVTGNNFELTGVPNQNNTPLTSYINNDLQTFKNQQHNVRERLGDYHIKYVLLLKEADWKNYTWIGNQKEFQPAIVNDKLILYKLTGDDNE